MSTRRAVSLGVNGKEHLLEPPDNQLLIDLLRYDLGLTGTKEGCSIGVCGACAVLLDGELVSSCLLLTVMAAGSEVTTIEGLAEAHELDSIQEAFVEQGGFQCGFCTPGQIMAARALLDEVPSPDEEQVREWMTGNLCRCTGYYKIVQSVLAASRTRRARGTPPGSSA